MKSPYKQPWYHLQTRLRHSKPRIDRISRLRMRIIILSWILVSLALSGMSVSSAADLGIASLVDNCNPLLFMPCFRAEATVTPIWVSVTSGKLTTAGQGISNLRDDLGLNRGALFLDTMVRLQFGPLSGRVYYEQRGLIGYVRVPNNPLVTARADFEYSGVGLGADLDLVRNNISRVGLNMDYQFYVPTFTQGILPLVPPVVAGENPLTIGAHAVYNPIRNFYGISGIFDIRARWSVSGATVNDAQASVGLKSPETVLGSVALKGGYRRTSIELTDAISNFEAVLSGWFGELAYYY